MSRNKNFLRLMSMLESSGNKNARHSMMPSGIHAGDTAIGQYGLMPNTIKEVVTRKPEKSELDKIILNSENHQIQPILEQNPHKYEEYASQLADRVLNKVEYDPELAASGWLYGHNMSKDRMSKKLETDPQYKKRIHHFIQSEGLHSPIENDREFIEELVQEQKPKDQLYSRLIKKVSK